MINKIINALKQNSLLIETANLEQLQNWQGKVQTDTRKLQPGDIFLTLGAGDNWKLAKALAERLDKKPATSK